MKLRPLMVSLLLGRLAVAEPEEVTAKRLEQLEQRAMENYDALEFDSAKKQLVEALDLAQKGGLGEDPIVAKLHLSLGIVYVAGLKDKWRGFQEFRKSLQIDPTTKIDPSVATPELQEVFQQAVDSLKLEAPPPSPPPPPIQEPTDGGEAVHGLIHTPIDEARAGFPIVVRVEAGPDVGAQKVVLHFRGSGQEDFAALPMTRKGTAWGAQIPSTAVRGRVMHYYVEALDVRSRPVAQNGSAASPNIITLTGWVAPPKPTGDGDGEERERNWTFGVGVGTGAGVVGFGAKSENIGANPPEEFCRLGEGGCEAVDITTGVAFSPFHLNAELTYKVATLWHIGAIGRFQLISGNEFIDYDEKSYLALARVKRYFSTDSWRFFLSGGLGVGEVRHGVNLGEAGGNHTDTVTSGKFAMGFGIGMNYDFGPSWGIVLEIHTLTLMPHAPSFHLDFNGGLQFMF